MIDGERIGADEEHEFAAARKKENRYAGLDNTLAAYMPKQPAQLNTTIQS